MADFQSMGKMTDQEEKTAPASSAVLAGLDAVVIEAVQDRPQAI